MRSGRVSVFIVFALNGIIIGSWAPRMPAFADQIGASHGVLGLALLGGSVGMIATASLAGRCVRPLRRPHDGAGVRARRPAVVLPVLALVALTTAARARCWCCSARLVGMLDVAMNVAAVTVIRRTERPLMPVFHAGFSFGALAGSIGAAFAAGHGLGLVPHFLIVSAWSWSSPAR